jgi:adenosylcobinamide-GDP ribazoletransferase
VAGRLNALRTAAAFLTRVPIDDPEPDLGGAVSWYPVVGAAIGLVCALTYVGAGRLWGQPTAAVAALAAGAMITGAFHSDGLADMADGFGGGWNREQRLEIMKDSRHGTYGVVSLVLLFGAQISTLAGLSPAQGAGALVAAQCLGRGASVALLVVGRPASASGLAAKSVMSNPRATLLAASAVSAAVTAAAFGGWAIVAITAAAVAAGAVGLLASRKINGITGDVLGASEQLAELAVLLVAAALTHRGVSWPWWR